MHLALSKKNKNKNISNNQENINEEVLKEEAVKKETVQEEILEENVKEEPVQKKVDEEDSEKKTQSKFVKSFTNRRFTAGVYSTIISVILVAVVVVLNLAMNNLKLSYDLTAGGLYSLSDEAVKIVKEIDTPITIYYLVTETGVDERIKNSIYGFEDINKNVKIVEQDPVLYPAFGEKYGIEDKLASNDVIVVNDETNIAQYISNDKLYFMAYASDESMNGETLDTEGRIVSAIQYVMSGKKNKVYCTQGHGETVFGDDYMDALEKLNTDAYSLNLTTKGEIPEDCDVLFIGGPQKDFKDSETELVLEYLKDGGDAIILTADTYAKYSDNKMKNFDRILDYYGVEVMRGYVYEGAGHYYQTQNYVVPTINTDSEYMKDLGKDSVIIAAAEGLKLQDKALRNSLTRTVLLSTSDESYLKKDVESGETEKEDEDIDGPINIGILLNDKTGDDESNVVVYSSYYFIMDNGNGTVYNPSVDNVKLISNAVSNMISSEVNAVSLPPKSLENVTVTIPVRDSIVFAVILIIALPGILLMSGFVIWLYRRKK